MEKILNKIDKNNITSSQNEYKLIMGNIIWDNPEQVFQSNKDLKEIITLKSILVSSIDSRPLEFSINRRLKRSFDIFFSILMITTILSWLIPVLMILIKLDSNGPVFFLQKRNKKNGRTFTCIKLRTMIVNKDADIIQASKQDIRITLIGKFLRKYHLDELPQFINVLLGDMSVIGPRPHMIIDNLLYEKLIQDYSYRFKVKPGITGLAQVMGFVGGVANLNKMKNRVDMDIFYIRHWSIKLDAIILYRTIFEPFR